MQLRFRGLYAPGEQLHCSVTLLGMCTLPERYMYHHQRLRVFNSLHLVVFFGTVKSLVN